MCHNCDESVHHIVSGCPVPAKDEYLHRHDKAAAHIHWNICKQYNLSATEKRMWGMKTLTIPVVFVALGIIKKGLDRYIRQIPGENLCKRDAKKILLLRTAHILRKTLSIK